MSSLKRDGRMTGDKTNKNKIKTKQTIDLNLINGGIEMANVTTEKELFDIFEKVGEKYEYTVIKTEFVAFSDFKVTWEGSKFRKTISFKISDFAMDMSEENIEVIAEMMFRRINNLPVEGEYKDNFNRCVLNKTFADKNRPYFIERKKLEKIPFKTIEDVDVHWSKVGLYNAGYASTLMKIIAINPELREAPEDVLDTVIKMEYNTIQDGVLSFGGKAKLIDVPKEEISRTKQWLVNNDIRLNEGLFN